MRSDKREGFSTLKSEKEIRSVFREGKKRENREFFVYYKENQKGVFRVGIFVPQRIFKKAVRRNRLRRIIKEILRRQSRKLKGVDLICIPKELREEVLNLNMLSHSLNSLIQKIL